MVDNISPGKRAILMWRGLDCSTENANKIKKKDYNCFFQKFIYFSILQKNRNLEDYRRRYAEKTGKSWETATIQDIYHAELVWDFC
jgi:hypothetical protein